MFNVILRFVRAVALPAALAVAGCSADPSATGAADGSSSGDENVASTTEALSTFGHAWLRTPAVKGNSSYQPIHCSDCARTSTGQAPQWATVATGTYLVKLPGVAPAANSPYVVHVTPYGKVGAECIVNGVTTSGNDMIFGVSCTNSLGSDTDSQFQLSYMVRSPSEQAPAYDLAFANVRNNALNGWYVSAAPGATFTRVRTGQYEVSFPGLRQSGKGGNAQVTSWTKGVRCNPIAWDASTANGVKVHVICASTFNVATDAAFSVSYTKGTLLAGEYGYVWLQNAADISTEKPAPLWNKSFSGDPNLLSSGMEIKRLSAGRYQVDFRRYGGGKRNLGLELTAVGDAQQSCVVMSTDADYAEVQCVKNGTPTNTQFSLRVGMNEGLKAGWNLLSGINFFENFGVGWGLICGQVALEPRQVMCSVPTAPGEVSPRITGPTLWPDSVRYVAVDNRDLTTTRVLVLGSDRVLRSTSGTLTKSWPAADNFASLSVVAQPTFNPGGANLNLIKITIVRDTSSNFVMGFTSDNRVVQLSGSQWIASSFPIPSGVTWRTISGDIGALVLVSTNGAMYRSVRGAGSATQLPALPNSLRAIGLGGDFVITNANMNAQGLVPCVTPKNSAGYYNCGDTNKRFYRFNDYGGWSEFVGGASDIPLTNTDAVLTGGNPLTRPPSLEDARLVHGDSGRSIYTYHYNARIYHRF
ncbi:MAG TPA: hypothetical protein VGK73_17730 [Polyangiaceae bacterium]